MFPEQAKVFDSDSASTNGVIDAGEKALKLIYNGKLPDNLDSTQAVGPGVLQTFSTCAVKP